MPPANPHYNFHGRTPRPDRPTLPTPAQRRCVDTWLARSLTLATPAELATALRGASAHPDAPATPAPKLAASASKPNSPPAPKPSSFLQTRRLS